MNKSNAPANSNDLYSLRFHWVSGALLTVSHAPSLSLWYLYQEQPHFSDVGTEAQRGSAACPGSTARKPFGPDFLAAQWSCPLSSLIAHPHGGARMAGRWGATRLLVLPWTQTWNPGAPSCLGVTVGEIMPVFLAIGVCEGREDGRDLESPNSD